MSVSIPGYRKGDPALPKAPLSWGEFEDLQKSVLFTDEDRTYLRMAGEILGPHVEDLLDVWYGFVGSNPHLLHYFTRKSDGKPDEGYLGAVRKRFGQWVHDTCAAQYDQEWLDYQFEIGRRHHRIGKNKTDNVDAVEHIPLRHLIALIAPIVITVRPFLQKSGRSAEDVEKMHQAWLKAVVLQVALWAYPYTKEGDF